MKALFKAEMNEQGAVNFEMNGTKRDIAEMFFVIFKENQEVEDILDKILILNKDIKNQNT